MVNHTFSNQTVVLEVQEFPEYLSPIVVWEHGWLVVSTLPITAELRIKLSPIGRG